MEDIQRAYKQHWVWILSLLSFYYQSWCERPL